jgi:predicted nucleic acid-binding protein
VRFLLDTNTCIGILTDRSPRLTARWKTMQASQLRLCSPVNSRVNGLKLEDWEIQPEP